jgi:hypothetical protein
MTNYEAAPPRLRIHALPVSGGERRRRQLELVRTGLAELADCTVAAAQPPAAPGNRWMSESERQRFGPEPVFDAAA